MAEILNLHDPEVVHGEVNLIKKGIELAFLYMTSLFPLDDSDESDPFPDLEDFPEDDPIFTVAGLAPADGRKGQVKEVPRKTNPYEENLNAVQEIAYLEATTHSRCGEAVDIALSFLEQFDYEFDCFRYSFKEGLKHFKDHAVGIVFSKKTKKWYVFSPANAFNSDFSLPSFKGGTFQRLDSIISATSYEDAMQMFAEIELEDGTTLPQKTELSRGPKDRYDIPSLMKQIKYMQG